jgi:hypothetical protein
MWVSQGDDVVVVEHKNSWQSYTHSPIPADTGWMGFFPIFAVLYLTQSFVELSLLVHAQRQGHVAA